MNKILFYGGFALAALFLLLAVFLFFYQRIPSVVGYFLKMKNRGTLQLQKSLQYSTRSIGSHDSTRQLTAPESTRRIAGDLSTSDIASYTRGGTGKDGLQMPADDDATDILDNGKPTNTFKAPARQTTRSKGAPAKIVVQADESTAVLDDVTEILE